MCTLLMYYLAQLPGSTEKKSKAIFIQINTRVFMIIPEAPNELNNTCCAMCMDTLSFLVWKH